MTVLNGYDLDYNLLVHCLFLPILSSHPLLTPSRPLPCSSPPLYAQYPSGYFLTVCSLPWPSPALTGWPHPLASLLLTSKMPFSIHFYPLLISPPAPDLASPGPLPSPSAYSFSFSLFLSLSRLSLPLSHSPVGGLVELDPVLLHPYFACVIFNRISCRFGC